ncbi:MAG: transmembrane 220 family protein [Flavobacteriales bacterium]
MQRTAYLFVTGCFIAFAALNLNDPDPWMWVVAYGAVALLYALAAFGRADRRVSGSLAVALGVWMLTMSGGMLTWFNMGMPSIVTEMKATEPHVEAVREFLGLLLAVIALAILTKRTTTASRLG